MSQHRPVALVTGSSSGIGATFARQLAARGYDLILVARRAERLEQLAADLKHTHGVDAEVLAADLTVTADLDRIEQRIKREERLDLLVNNAGFGVPGTFTHASVEAQDRMHRLHVLAPLHLTHAALAGMVPRGHGGIINVSSVAAFGNSPGGNTYGTTKAWMNSFCDAVSLELRCMGSPVKIQALCPGYTYSEFHDVVGIDRRTIPASWWMSAEDVVTASLRGLDHGKLIVVPGLLYKLIVLGARLAPRFLQRAALARFSRKTHRL